MSERKEITIGGDVFYLDKIGTQTVLVQVLPEARPDPFGRTSTARRTGSDPAYVSGKGRRNRYHIGGRTPQLRAGYRLTTKED